MRYGQPVGLMPGLSPAVKRILYLTVGIFVLQLALRMTTGVHLTYWFGLTTAGVLNAQVWRLVSYIFLHGNLWHIFLNMLILVMFGREIEALLGRRRFLVLYLACGVLAGIGWMLISGRGYAVCIGASGAVFGILGLFAAVFPERRITLLLFFVLPVTMSARTMAIGLAVISLFALMGGDGNIAHAAHLGGGVAGYLYGWRLWRAPGRRAAGGSPPRTRFEAPPPDREEIDRVLEKVNESGIGSLTRHDRDVLERASRARRR